MDEKRKPSHSHLFRIRLWIEYLGNGRSEWRGKVHHVLSGKQGYFRDWKELQEQMESTLDDHGQAEGNVDGQPAA